MSTFSKNTVYSIFGWLMANEWTFFSRTCRRVCLAHSIRCLCGDGDSSKRVEPVSHACPPDRIGNKLTENLERRSKEKLTKAKERLINGSMMSKTNSPEELIRRKSSRLGHHWWQLRIRRRESFCKPGWRPLPPLLGKGVEMSALIVRAQSILRFYKCWWWLK